MTETPTTEAREPEAPPPDTTAPAPTAFTPEKSEPPWLGLVVLPAILFGLYRYAGWKGVVIGLAIVLIIVLHELGHYTAARLGGMRVTEFFVGFGPRLWSIKRGETEYGVKALWLGGYVKIPGMTRMEEIDPADEARAYRQATFPRRFAVAVAGSTVHFVLCLLLLYPVLALHGIDRDETQWTVGAVQAGTPAAAAGIEPGDDVVSVDGVAVPSFFDLAPLFAGRAGDEVLVEVLRDDGTSVTLPVTLGVNPETGAGFLGVGPTFPTIKPGPIGAIGDTFELFGTGAKETVLAIPRIFSFDSIRNLFNETRDDDTVTSGDDAAADDGERPVSIVGVIDVGAQLFDEGLAAVALFLVSINLFFGVFNLLPILPFDGGHVVIACYERIREALRGSKERYFADVTKMLPIAYTIVMVLLMVSLLAVYVDVTEGVNI